jgi:hypothetical protein
MSKLGHAYSVVSTLAVTGEKIPFEPQGDKIHLCGFFV